MASEGKGPIAGHEKLTMADQMRAAAVPSSPRTSPVTGAEVNPRREYIKRAVAMRSARASNPGTIRNGEK